MSSPIFVPRGNACHHLNRWDSYVSFAGVHPADKRQAERFSQTLLREWV
jgi:hypothetical protein